LTTPLMLARPGASIVPVNMTPSPTTKLFSTSKLSVMSIPPK